MRTGIWTGRARLPFPPSKSRLFVGTDPQAFVVATIARVQSLAIAVVGFIATWQLLGAPRVLPWWWGAGWLVAWGALALLAVVGVQRPQLVRWVSLLAYFLALAMILSVRPEFFRHAPAVGWQPIAFMFTPLGAACLATVVRPIPAMLGALPLMAAEAWVWARMLSGSPMISERLVLIAVLAAVVSLGTDRMRRAAREVRNAELERARARATAAAVCAEALEGARWDGLVHDDVVATLELAAQGILDPVRLGERAAHDLRLIARGGRGDGAGESLLARVRASARTHGASFRMNGSTEPHLEPWVVEALAAACEEALRNVKRHAGTARAWVEVSCLADAVEIVVSDDGMGFDVAAVDPLRLGLRVAVYGQVEAVGGWAEVDSSPGAGTRVRLGWGGGVRDA